MGREQHTLDEIVDFARPKPGGFYDGSETLGEIVSDFDVRQSTKASEELDNLRAALALLRRLEWSGCHPREGDPVCPDCGGAPPDSRWATSAVQGHEPTCELARLIGAKVRG